MMKKLFLMALAAITLVTFSSCSKSDDDNGGGGGGSSPELPAAPYKGEGKKLIISANTSGINQIRLMESGAFMIACKGGYASKKIFSRADTRGEDDIYYEFGKYNYSNGQYTFDNGMVVSYEASGSDANVTVTWANGTTISTTGTIDTSTTVTSGVITDNLCSRAWTVNRVIAKATFEGVTLGKEFSAPIDLAKVKAWYEENFGTLRDQFDANTIINGIYFDNQGLFAINYQNRNPDVGDWRWQSMDIGSLVYSWLDRARAISLFTGAASVEFDNNTLNLTLKGNVDGKDMEFKFYLR
jgi:hypothetical protein